MARPLNTSTDVAGPLTKEQGAAMHQGRCPICGRTLTVVGYGAIPDVTSWTVRYDCPIGHFGRWEEN